jgi:hypothetical protein
MAPLRQKIWRLHSVFFKTARCSRNSPVATTRAAKVHDQRLFGMKKMAGVARIELAPPLDAPLDAPLEAMVQF